MFVYFFFNESRHQTEAVNDNFLFMLQAWLKILNVEKTMAENVGVYKRMLELAREFSTEVR